MGDNSKRGLASADQETREEVARMGGEAPHKTRGRQSEDEQYNSDVRKSSNQEEGEGIGWFEDSEGHRRAVEQREDQDDE
jgi:hypothetical protein